MRLSRDRYYSLLQAPSLLSAPSPGDEPRYLDPDAFPAFNGTGLSLSLWFRNADCGESAVCGTHLLYQHDAGRGSGSACWGVRLQSDGVYFDNARPDPPRSGLRAIPRAGRYGLDHTTWRHVAVVWDHRDDHAAYYLDGELAVRFQWGSSVAEMDCPERPGLNQSDQPGRIVAVGHAFPGWTGGAGLAGATSLSMQWACQLV